MYQYPTQGQMTRNQRKRKMREQRLMGVLLLAIAVFIIWFCASANEDCGGGIVVGAFAIPLLFSKNIWIL
nr:hypothetical protein [Acutalibacter muris]